VFFGGEVLMRRLTVLLVVVVTMLACGFADLRNAWGDPVELGTDDLVGVWATIDGRQLVFDPDGTFNAIDLPYGAFASALRGTSSPPEGIDGSGTWRLRAPEREGLSSAVRLRVDRLAGRDAGHATKLTALKEHGEVYLVFFWNEGRRWSA
jgi:hypothetical protein